MAASATLALVLPPLSARVGKIDEIHNELPAINTPTDVVEPTAAQLELVRDLGAAVTWPRPVGVNCARA